MRRRVTLGVLVAVVAGWVLSGVGGPPRAAAGQPRPGAAISQGCHIHSRVTVDRSAAIVILLRTCDRP